MKRSVVDLLMAGAIVLMAPCQSALALDDLFPDSPTAFPDVKSGGSSSSGAKSKSPFSDFSDFSTTDIDKPINITKQDRPDPAAAAKKRAIKEQVARADEQMRQEIQKVASWLQEFSMRNLNRFPGVYGDSNTIQRASEVQLTELVGSNPYASVATEISQRELNGLSPGLSYYYNPDGTVVTGSPYASDEWTSELTAGDAGRVKLTMDQSASAGEVDSYRTGATSNLEGSPGTIMAAGNGQGFLYVWGEGIDGKPVKDADGKSAYFATADTTNVIGNTGQEAGY